ncbi:hypothetical protein [Geothermobacter ehrlichii]|uniref:hypothetical protein n=1 Tax=Geothermobacter ehrlichii TaxID=213224 RepID=UPI0011E68234|nr:hypothetical protein [Geothermobacter ehrlichii]
MSRHSITLKRDGVCGFLSNQSIGTDALNALRRIPGIEDLEIISESEEKVEIRYTWNGKGKFWETNDILLKHGLVRADSK